MLGHHKKHGCLLLSHYLNQWWIIAHWNKFKWHFKQTSPFFLEENALESGVGKMAAILFWPQCVNLHLHTDNRRPGPHKVSEHSSGKTREDVGFSHIVPIEVSCRWHLWNLPWSSHRRGRGLLHCRQCKLGRLEMSLYMLHPDELEIIQQPNECEMQYSDTLSDNDGKY